MIIQSGLLGHQNDAQILILYRQKAKTFPDERVILEDTLFPNIDPFVTAYTRTVINGRP